ncbi:MAG: valine--tRNA ligase [Candidatus Omnitrophota bacterium]|nr:valine--tRNA ligase [Candidatus Omnitrophota bacterium]
MEIPSKYNSKDVESKILKEWLDKGCFNADVNTLKEPFCIVIPPPNITGILHMGHALNSTIQDVLIRFNRMKGLSALWMPGTDHAGIATQNVVERDLAKKGVKKEDIGRDKFLGRLWAWRDQYGTTILNQLKSLGASCDWRRTRFTMDDDYSQVVKDVFISLYDKGLIYRGNYIINWCPRCQTALSDEESAHREIDGWLYYIKYPIRRMTDDGRRTTEYVVVATTRPETMFGDTAVAINPKDERYKGLKGAKVILPIVDRELKVIEDEAIDPEFGTGVVKVTPAHDPVDFMLGKKHGLESINIMEDNAVLNKNVPQDFIGMDRFEARAALIEVLEEKKLIDKKEPYKISAGHCYRCHTIVEPRLSLQWFVKMKPLAKDAITVVENDEIKFYPPRWKKVYLNWMNNISDWCISRQIWWGHRLPVYYCRSCQSSAVSSQQEKAESGKQIADSLKGIIVSKETPQKCPDCGGTDIYQDEDVLDTWFSSWLWPFATFGKTTDSELRTPNSELNYFYPTNVLVTASEILFFWVARMIMAGLEFKKAIPFRNVLIHGTVRDSKGVKMSKSLGNTIDPLDIIEKFGADSLRFSLMLLAASGSDVYLSDDKFLVGRNFANKIWNATRFLFLKINESNFKIDSLELEIPDVIDKWVLKQLNDTIDRVNSELENNRINEATKAAYDFFWHIFCDWYIEIAKDNFTQSKAKVLIYTLINALKLLHPVMPFITEEIFQIIKQQTSLDLEDFMANSTWPVKAALSFDGEEAKILEIVIETIKTVRNIKTDLNLGTKKVALEVSLKKDDNKFWETNKGWIEKLTFSAKISFKSNLERVLYRNDLWEINLGIDDIDTKNFLAALEKKTNNLEKVLGKAIDRLANEKFLHHAAAETVENEKVKVKDLTLQVGRLKDLIKAFEGGS